MLAAISTGAYRLQLMQLFPQKKESSPGLSTIRGCLIINLFCFSWERALPY
jgi:hypothetical protein